MSKENKMIKKFILTSLTIGGVITARQTWKHI
jgi:hypothetical protein